MPTAPSERDDLRRRIAVLAARMIAEVERPLLRLALSATRGNQIKAAAMLGLNRNTLRKKLKDLELPVVRGLA